jgi:drug/metabolite transporter (DMT)-like permease
VKSAAILAAAATPVLFGIGSVLQKAAADRVETVRGLDPRLLGRLLRRGGYLLGWACDATGWLLQVLALTTLPLFVVQSFVAMGTGWTAGLAWWLLGARLSRWARPALALTVAAGVALAVSAPVDRPVRLGPSGLLAAAAGLAALLAGGTLLARRVSRWSAAALGALAGAGFSLVAVLDKAVAPLPGHPIAGQLTTVLRTPAPYLLVTAGVAAALLYSTGLQRGQVVAVEAPLVALELALPTVIGVALLGEALPGGWRLPMAAAGLAGALTGSLLLASEPGPSAPAPPAGPAPRRSTPPSWDEGASRKEPACNPGEGEPQAAHRHAGGVVAARGSVAAGRRGPHAPGVPAGGPAVGRGRAAARRGRTERAVEALHEEIRHDAPTLRDGQWMDVIVTELVPGDVVRLELDRAAGLSLEPPPGAA